MVAVGRRHARAGRSACCGWRKSAARNDEGARASCDTLVAGSEKGEAGVAKLAELLAAVLAAGVDAGARADHALDRPRTRLLHRHGLRDVSGPAARHRQRLLRRALRQPGRPVHQGRAARHRRLAGARSAAGGDGRAGPGAKSQHAGAGVHSLLRRRPACTTICGWPPQIRAAGRRRRGLSRAEEARPAAQIRRSPRLPRGPDRRRKRIRRRHLPDQGSGDGPERDRVAGRCAGGDRRATEKLDRLFQQGSFHVELPPTGRQIHARQSHAALYERQLGIDFSNSALDRRAIRGRRLRTNKVTRAAAVKSRIRYSPYQRKKLSRRSSTLQTRGYPAGENAKTPRQALRARGSSRASKKCSRQRAVHFQAPASEQGLEFRLIRRKKMNLWNCPEYKAARANCQLYF